MSEPQVSFGGLIVPTLTPLTEDERLDPAGLERHLNFLIENGADAIFILGSNGEGAMLRSSTRLDVVTESVRVVAGRVPVISGVLEISTLRIVEEVERIGGMGLAGYVVTTPLYFDGFSESDLLAHFRTVAEAADAPVLLYNIPQFTATALSESLIRKLAEVPNIVGLKDSSGNWTAFQRLLLDRPRPGFSLLQGTHSMTAVSLFVGADGLVPGYANLHPGLFVDLLAAAERRQWDEVLRLQAQLDRLLSLRGPANLHANKVIGKALGLMDDFVTSPLPKLDQETADLLLRESAAAGLPIADVRDPEGVARAAVVG